MDLKDKLRIVNFRAVILPLSLVTIVLIIIISFITRGVEKHHYDYLHKEALDFAHNYSNNLINARESTEIINNMLEEKLLVASKVIASSREDISDDLLIEMTQLLELDSIYFYNSEGRIIYSTDEELLGWETYQGHATYKFMKADKNYCVEEIRRVEVLGTYYKFGYSKLSDGTIVQVGIKAEKVNSVLNTFKTQSILEKMKDNTSAQELCLINDDLKIIASTNKEIINTNFKNEEVKEYILTNENYDGKSSIEGESVFEVYIPIYLDNQKIGTLHYAKPIIFSMQITRQIRIIGIIGSLVIFILLMSMIITNYNKNKKLIKLAYFDNLTDLPNREYLLQFLSETLKDGNKRKKAIFLINCIEFKNINLVLGYDYGDKVLNEIAKRLKIIIKKPDRLFRFTADEFVILIDNYNNTDELKKLAETINRIFDKSPIIENKHIEVEISIVELNDSFIDANQIMQDATIALNYIEKKNNLYIIFDNEMEKRIEREELIANRIINLSIEKDNQDLYLEYQPIVDLKTDKVVGFEALARMKIEKLGFVSPLEFIAIAEKKNLIIDLGEDILIKACKFINRLYGEGYKDFKVAVNISGIQLLHNDFNDCIKSIINKYEIKGENLEFEITESIVVENFDIINEKLRELKGFGIRISLDDFGTGYSSFARLRELNVDYLKVDGFFIKKIDGPHNKNLITGDIISMSHKMKLAVVAEGVETKEQKDYLINHNCDYMQGYLFSRPLVEDKALQILKDVQMI